MSTRSRPATFIYSGIAFGIPTALVAGWITGDVSDGLQAGLLGGLAFGSAMSRFVRTAETSTLLEPDGKAAGFDEGETVLRSGVANHFKGWESVGGKLYLTNRRLRFRSHKANIQVHDESFPIGDITGARTTRTLGIVPNGLLVDIAGGKSERFVVTDRGNWVKAIDQARARSVTGAARSTGQPG